MRNTEQEARKLTRDLLTRGIAHGAPAASDTIRFYLWSHPKTCEMGRRLEEVTDRDGKADFFLLSKEEADELDRLWG